MFVNTSFSLSDKISVTIGCSHIGSGPQTNILIWFLGEVGLIKGKMRPAGEDTVRIGPHRVTAPKRG